jgi:hypothetical protein
MATIYQSQCSETTSLLLLWKITDGNDHHGSLDEFEDAFECGHIHVCYVVIELSTQNMVS